MGIVLSKLDSCKHIIELLNFKRDAKLLRLSGIIIIHSRELLSFARICELMKRLSRIRIVCEQNICLVFSECCFDGGKTLTSLTKKASVIFRKFSYFSYFTACWSASRDLVNSVMNCREVIILHSCDPFIRSVLNKGFQRKHFVFFLWCYFYCPPKQR